MLGERLGGVVQGCGDVVGFEIGMLIDNLGSMVIRVWTGSVMVFSLHIRRHIPLQWGSVVMIGSALDAERMLRRLSLQ